MFPKKFYMNSGVGHMHELQYIREKSLKKKTFGFSLTRQKRCAASYCNC